MTATATKSKVAVPSKTRSAYDGNVLLEFFEGRHQYKVNGERVDGVTTILGVINKPWLTAWASKEACKFLGYYDRELWTPQGFIPAPAEDVKAGHKILKKRLSDVKKMTANQYWDFLKLAKGAPNRKRDDAADKGTAVHAYCEAFIKNQNPAMPEDPQVRAGAEAFLRWVEMNKVSFTSSEHMVCSVKHGYAGTLDWTAEVNGKHILGDLKTSSQISGGMGYQLALYRNAVVEELGYDPYEGQIIVNARKDGSLEVREEWNYPGDLVAALAAIPLYRREKQIQQDEKEKELK